MSPHDGPASPRASRGRTWGVCLALLGAAAVAPDGVLLRSMQKGGLPNLVIFAWKFFFAAAIQFFFVLWGRGGPPTLRCLCSCWKWVTVAALCTMGAALNTMSNLETTSASALLFFYVAPLWALVFGMLLLREAMPRRTVLAVSVALAGVCLLFVPSVLDSRDAGANGAPPPAARADATRHVANFRGDALGLLSGLAMAGYLTTCRHASVHKPEAPMVLGVAVGSLAAALVGLYLCVASGHSLFAVPSGLVPLLLLDCVGIGIYGLMSSLATAYLPGAEVAFLLLMDVLLAPALVALVHGEMPSAAGSSGAALLAAAVLGHEFAALRDSQTARANAKVGVALPSPPTVAACRGKLRVSDANLHGLMPSADDADYSAVPDMPSPQQRPTPAKAAATVEIELAAETSSLLVAGDDAPSDSEGVAPPLSSAKRVSWGIR